MHRGIVRSFEKLHPAGHLLDLGCGDGRVGFWAAENLESSGLQSYLGADYSSALLGQHFHAANAPEQSISFICADITATHWVDRVAAHRKQFDSATFFSALHHIPGPRRRLRLMQALQSLLPHGGRCAVSVWQLSHVPRLQKKIRPWSEVGIATSSVEASDFLVDWKMGGAGLRYVHEFTEDELRGLCIRAGFSIEDVYRSDGQTGDMGLYCILKKP